MRMHDINKRFTETVNEYLAKGFVFAQTMRGHQGELMKVDLTDGTCVIRVSLERFFEHNKETWFASEGVELIVERHEMPGYVHTTLWTGKGENILSKRFFMIGGRHIESEDAYFTDDIQEATKADEVKTERLEASRIKNRFVKTDVETLKIALKYVKRQAGCKTKHLEDIKQVVLHKDKAGTIWEIDLSNGKRFILQ